MLQGKLYLYLTATVHHKSCMKCSGRAPGPWTLECRYCLLYGETRLLLHDWTKYSQYTVTGLRTGRSRYSESNASQLQEIYPFSEMEPTQRISLVQGALSPGVKRPGREADNSPRIVLILSMLFLTPPLPHTQRDSFTSWTFFYTTCRRKW